MREFTPKEEKPVQISSRLTVAVHTLLAIEYFHSDHKVTSEFIASSVCVNPVVIRRILLQLKDAGLVDVARGSGGAVLKRPPQSISLLDVYRAVDCLEKESMFHFHENPNAACPVGSRIHAALDGKLAAAQNAFEQSLAATSLAELMNTL